MPKRVARKTTDLVEDFRRIALSMRDVIESSHMEHPDFRVGGRIFATLGYPNHSWGVIKLTPEEQREFIQSHPSLFAPVKGAWGERGATTVNLDHVDEDTLRSAIRAAWSNTARKVSAAPPSKKLR